jgi:flagella basal body P-ring formation protein FlgA
MSALLATALLLAPGPAPAQAGARVPAQALEAVALAALQAKAGAENVDARFSPATSARDVELPPGATCAAPRAEAPARWLSPRAAVPVRIDCGNNRVLSALLWFEVSAPAKGVAYAADYSPRSSGTAVQLLAADIDLATTHGAPLVDKEALATLRLKHNVVAGAPALASDFQPMPAVQAQQRVRIDLSGNGMHLSIPGRALRDGAIGEVIDVLPSNATRPVQARVASAQVVTLED